MADDHETGEQEVAAAPEDQGQNPQSNEQNQEHSKPSAEEQERNWKDMRIAMKELAEKNRALEEQMIQMAQGKKETSEPDEFESLSEDDIPTVKHLKQYSKKTYEKAKQEAFQEFYNKTAEERLEVKYPDYRSVVSADNIEKLKQRYPDLARSLASNSDAYSQGKAAYDMIVSLGIHNAEADVNRKKMQQNAQKPQMTGGAKQGPLSTAHIFESGQKPPLTKALKEQLLKEMHEATAGY